MGTKFRGKQEEERALSAFINLMRCADSLGGRLQNHADLQHGLSPSQFGSLEALLHLGPMSQRELSQKLLKSGGNITMVVDNLEKQGLVKRGSHPQDRRISVLELTAKGRKLIEKIFPAHARVINEMFSVLSPKEQEELRRLCRKLGKQEK